jgi:hypothetical protein
MITTVDKRNTTFGLVALAAVAPLVYIAVKYVARPRVVLAWRVLLDNIRFSRVERVYAKQLIDKVNGYFSEDADATDLIEKEILRFDSNIVVATEPDEAVEAKPKVVRRRHEFRMFIVAKIKAKCGGTPKSTPAMVKAVSEIAVKFMEEHNHRAAHIVRDLPHIRMMVFVATQDEIMENRLRDQLDLVLNAEAMGQPESLFHH